MKIYVVFGSTGEYSDRDEWMVIAYADADTAAAVVIDYYAKAKEVEARCRLDEDNPKYIDRSNQWNPGFKWPHPDPNFRMDYTGTTYYVDEVDLADRP